MEENKALELTGLLRWALLVLLPLALLLAITRPALPEAAYGALLGQGSLHALGEGTLRPLAFASIAATLLILYWAFRQPQEQGQKQGQNGADEQNETNETKEQRKEQNESAWIVLVLLAISPLFIQELVLIHPQDILALPLGAAALAILHRRPLGMPGAVAILPALAALYFVWSLDGWHAEPLRLLEGIRSAGWVAPMAFLSLVLAGLKNRWQGVYWIIAGLLLCMFSYALAVLVWAMAALQALQAWRANPEESGWWAAIVALGVAYLLLNRSGTIDYGVVAVVAGGIGLAAYLIISIYNRREGFWTAAMMLVVVLALALAQGTMIRITSETASPDLLKAFQLANGKGGQLTVFGFNNTYAYSTGRSARVVPVASLFYDSRIEGDYLVFTRAQLSAYPSGRTFEYAGRDAQSARLLFTGGQFLLAIQLDDAQAQVASAVLIDRSTGGQNNVPFNKLRRLDRSLPWDEPASLLVHTDGIEDSELYRLLSAGQYDYHQNGVWMVSLHGE